MRKNRSNESQKGDVMKASQTQDLSFPEQRHDLDLLKQDDLIRFLLLDSVLGFPSSKCFPNHKRTPPHIQEKIAQLLKVFTFVPAGAVHAANAIKLLVSEYLSDSTGRTMQMVDNYLCLYKMDSGFTFAECFKFPMEGHVGLKLIATKQLKVGDILESHNFSTPFISCQENREKGWCVNEYSVTTRLRDSNYGQCMWLGPSAIFNHSCENNAMYKIHSKKVLIAVTKPIDIGEEILVHYGKDYFDHCLCSSCIAGREKPENKDGVSIDDEEGKVGRTRHVRRSAGRPCYNPSLESIEEMNRMKKTISIFLKMFQRISYPEPIRDIAKVSERDLMRSAGMTPLADFLDYQKVKKNLSDDINFNSWLTDIFSTMESAHCESKQFDVSVKIQSIMLNLMRNDLANSGDDSSVQLKYEARQKAIIDKFAALREIYSEKKEDQEDKKILIQRKEEHEKEYMERHWLKIGDTKSLRDELREQMIETGVKGRVTLEKSLLVPGCPAIYRAFLGDDIDPRTPVDNDNWSELTHQRNNRRRSAPAIPRKRQCRRGATSNQNVVTRADRTFSDSSTVLLGQASDGAASSNQQNANRGSSQHAEEPSTPAPRRRRSRATRTINTI